MPVSTDIPSPARRAGTAIVKGIDWEMLDELIEDDDYKEGTGGDPPPPEEPEPPEDPCTAEVCGITDTFERTVVNGWGTSDATHQWVTLPPAFGYSEAQRAWCAPAFSVTDGFARIDPEAAQDHIHTFPEPNLGADCAVALPRAIPPGTKDVRLRFRFLNTTTDDEFDAEPQFYFSTDDADLIHGIDIFADFPGPDSYINLLAYGDYHPGDVDFIDLDTGFFTYSNWYWLHFLVTGGRIQASLWRDDEEEPLTWQLEAGDETYVFASLIDTFYAYLPNLGQSVEYADLEIGAVNRCNAVQFDYFQRVEAVGLGTALPADITWENASVPAAGLATSVDGSSAVFTMTQQGRYTEWRADVEGTPLAADDVTLRSQFRINTVGSARFTELLFGLRSVTDGDDLVILGLHNDVASTAPVIVQIGDNFGEDGPMDPAITVPGFFVANTWYYVKFHRVRGTLLEAKAWVVGEPEPEYQAIWSGSLPQNATKYIWFSAAPGGSPFTAIAPQVIEVAYLEADYEDKPCYPGA